MLAAVAGKLLLESGGVSSSSSNNASGDNNEDQCGGKKEPGDQMVVEEPHCDHHDDNNAERSFFVSEILPKAHEMESFNRSPNPNKDFLFGSTSGITYDSSEKFGTQELAYEEAKIHNGDCFRSDTNDKKPMLERLNCEPGVSRNKDKHPIHLLNGIENNDGENFSARYTTKSFRSTLRVGDGRVKKFMSSKYCKVSSNQKDTMVASSGKHVETLLGLSHVLLFYLCLVYLSMTMFRPGLEAWLLQQETLSQKLKIREEISNQEKKILCWLYSLTIRRNS